MTVKELIEKLQEIEDKNQECIVNDGDNFWDIWSLCEGENDAGVVWGYEKESYVEIRTFFSDI